MSSPIPLHLKQGVSGQHGNNTSYSPGLLSISFNLFKVSVNLLHCSFSDTAVIILFEAF